LGVKLYCLLGYLVDPEDGGNKFLRNTLKLLLDYGTKLHNAVFFTVTAVRSSNFTNTAILCSFVTN
jgi:hypothetical protein